MIAATFRMIEASQVVIVCEVMVDEWLMRSWNDGATDRFCEPEMSQQGTSKVKKDVIWCFPKEWP